MMKFFSSRPAIAAAMALATTLTVSDTARAQFIEFNDLRSFQLTLNTVIIRNGSPISRFGFIQVGTGARGFIQVGTGQAKGLDDGVLLSVELDDALIGPVTSVNPLTVLSIPVVTTGDTVQVGLADLSVGDEVLVSGYSDANSDVRATRIERAAEPLDHWSIEGFAQSVSATGFSVGPRTIDYGTALLEDCPGDVIPEGQFVEVEFAPVPNFVAGMDLVADEVDCDDDRFVDDGLQVIEGLITSVAGPNQFAVDDQVVTTDVGTLYLNGTSRDVRRGVRVEVEGLVDPGTRQLTASQVRFRDIEVDFTAPVAPEDIILGESITILRNTLTVNAQTEDVGGLLTNGIATPTQLEVFGYIDGTGALIAEEVELEGVPELDDVALRGPVAAIAEPVLTILGVTVDTTGAAFEDALGGPIAAGAFFAQLSEGTSVGVEEGLYDPISNTLSGGVIRIETEGDEDDDAKDGSASRDGKIGATGGRLVGTITAISEVVFANGFE